MTGDRYFRVVDTGKNLIIEPCASEPEAMGLCESYNSLAFPGSRFDMKEIDVASIRLKEPDKLTRAETVDLIGTFNDLLEGGA
jgi:hypothetical protein